MNVSRISKGVLLAILVSLPMATVGAPINLRCTMPPYGSVVYRVDWELGTVDGQAASLDDDGIVWRQTLSTGEVIETIIERRSLILRIDSSMNGLVLTGKCSSSAGIPRSSSQSEQSSSGRSPTSDSSARRMELMQEKQLAMQELQLQMTTQQSLMQEHQNIQQRLQQLANSAPSGMYGRVAAMQEQQALVTRRSGIAEEYRASKDAETRLRDQVRNLDAKINAAR